MTTPQDTPYEITELIKDGLISIPFFIHDDDAMILMNLVDSDPDSWYLCGFEQPRRVQRFLEPQAATSNIKDRFHDEYHRDICCLNWLIDRFMEVVRPLVAKRILNRPTEILVEERIPSSHQPTVNENIASSTFEYSNIECNCLNCGCESNNTMTSFCTCYVAYLTLFYPCTHYMNKPRERDVDCWPLETENHQIQFTMNSNSLVLKWGEAVSHWRYRVFPTKHNLSEPLEADGDLQKRLITIKFKCPSINVPVYTDCNRTMSVPRSISLNNMNLSELITVVVTTSPIKSHPSTELIERVFDTFHLGGHEFAISCPKVIICDGCRVQDADSEAPEGSFIDTPRLNQTSERKISRKYANTKQALRNGIATVDQAENYKIFKARLRQVCEVANQNSPFSNTKIVELDERHGYGFALRAAIKDHVFTPFVCVIQHDRTFMRKTPIKNVVEAMVNDERVKYVGLSMRSNLIYRDLFLSKYGKVAANDLCQLVLLPEELVFEREEWLMSIEEMKNLQRNVPWENILQLSQTYLKSLQYSSHVDMLQNRSRSFINENSISLQQIQCSLTPTVFWYDNVHICRTDHYRDFVFSWKHKMVKSGGFVEDKLSPALVRALEKHGLMQGHAKFGCYLLDDHSGFFFTGHMDGGNFIAGKDLSYRNGTN